MNTIILCDNQQKFDFLNSNLDTSELNIYVYSEEFNENILDQRTVVLWGNFPKHIPKLNFQILRYFSIQKDFDVFSKEWLDDEFRKFINSKLTEKPLQEKPEEQIQSYTNNSHFRMLGYDKDEASGLIYFFFSYDAKTIIKLRPSAMTKSNLMMLAPLNFWEGKFGDGSSRTSKFDTDAAQQFLIQNSHHVGIFKDRYIRGRGAWMDDGRLVVHTGDSLIVDLEPRPLKNFPSKYVYEINESLGFEYVKPLVSSQSRKIIDKCKWLMWEREINPYLLAGWCVVAPFCGVVDWRAHIWVTGPSGSGKTWTMENIIKQLLGEMVITVQGDTTSSGIKGLLQSDALPVMFDESDVDGKHDKERIQSVVSVVRSSSSKDSGGITKGTQSGGARTVHLNSMFAFSSIGIHLNQQSDKSRFTILGLMSFDKIRTDEDFNKFTIEWLNLVTPDFVKSLQSRTMQLIPVILRNAKTFSQAVKTAIGNRRIGDQAGILLAGAYSLSSTSVISYEKALEWVIEKDWSDEKALELTKDEYRLFGTIMSFVSKIDGEFRSLDRSIGEVILISKGDVFEQQINEKTAENHLKRYGLLIKNDRLYISNTADGVQKILKDSPWSSNYNKILERLPEAKRENSMDFSPGVKTRAVSLPLSMITTETIKTPSIGVDDEKQKDLFDNNLMDAPF